MIQFEQNEKVFVRLLNFEKAAEEEFDRKLDNDYSDYVLKVRQMSDVEKG